jgi:hypothetical protein
MGRMGLLVRLRPPKAPLQLHRRPACGGYRGTTAATAATAVAAKRLSALRSLCG